MLIPLKGHDDERGSLTVLEPLPFEPKRIFTVSSRDAFKWRGGHVLRTCHLLMVCTSGYMQVNLNNGSHQLPLQYRLLPQSTALHIRPMTWVDYCFGLSGGSALILASELFDAEAYIDDYSEFLRNA